MSVDVTVRHTEVTAAAQDYARRKAEEIAGEFPRVEHVHVILDVEKYLFKAEMVVQAKNHIRVEAEEKSDEMKSALDKAFDKVEIQLRKRRDRALDHKPVMKQEETSRGRVEMEGPVDEEQ